MRKHFAKSHEAPKATPEPSTSGSTPAKQPRTTQYAVSTNPQQKAKFDKDIGRFFFANNIAFRAVESEYFVVGIYIFFFLIFEF